MLKKVLPVILSLAVLCGCSHMKLKRKNVKYMELEIARTCTAIKDGYFQNAKTEFSSLRDKNVYAFAQFRYVDNKPYSVEFEWFSPSGRYHKSEAQTVSDGESFYERVSLFQSLDITDMAEYGLLGKWRTVVRLNGNPLHTLEFEVVR